MMIWRNRRSKENMTSGLRQHFQRHSVTLQSHNTDAVKQHHPIAMRNQLGRQTLPLQLN